MARWKRRSTVRTCQWMKALKLAVLARVREPASIRCHVASATRTPVASSASSHIGSSDPGIRTEELAPRFWRSRQSLGNTPALLWSTSVARRFPLAGGGSELVPVGDFGTTTSTPAALRHGGLLAPVACCLARTGHLRMPGVFLPPSRLGTCRGGTSGRAFGCVRFGKDGGCAAPALRCFGCAGDVEVCSLLRTRASPSRWPSLRCFGVVRSSEQ